MLVTSIDEEAPTMTLENVIECARLIIVHAESRGKTVTKASVSPETMKVLARMMAPYILSRSAPQNINSIYGVDLEENKFVLPNRIVMSDKNHNILGIIYLEEQRDDD